MLELGKMEQCTSKTNGGTLAGNLRPFSVNGLHLKTRRQVDLNLGPLLLGSELRLPHVALTDLTLCFLLVAVPLYPQGNTARSLFMLCQENKATLLVGQFLQLIQDKSFWYSVDRRKTLEMLLTDYISCHKAKPMRPSMTGLVLHEA